MFSHCETAETNSILIEIHAANDRFSDVRLSQKSVIIICPVGDNKIPTQYY